MVYYLRHLYHVLYLKFRYNIICVGFLANKFAGTNLHNRNNDSYSLKIILNSSLLFIVQIKMDVSAVALILQLNLLYSSELGCKTVLVHGRHPIPTPDSKNPHGHCDY